MNLQLHVKECVSTNVSAHVSAHVSVVLTKEMITFVKAMYHLGHK